MGLRLHQAMNSSSLSPSNIPGTRNDEYNIEIINFLTSLILLLTSNESPNEVNTYYTKTVSSNRQIHYDPNAQHCRRQQCTALLVTAICYVIINNNKQVVSFKVV